MTFNEAARFLKVSLRGLTADVVRAAYAARVKDTHPDLNGTVPPDAAAHLARAKAARDKLLRYLGNERVPCPHCNGSGYQ